MFISIALTLTTLAVAQAWLYDGTTPIDCVEAWSDWECYNRNKQYSINQIYRHPFAGGAPCLHENGEVRKRDADCNPTAGENARRTERYVLSLQSVALLLAAPVTFHQKRDILILLDTSGSISPTAFSQVKEDLGKLVKFICPLGEVGKDRANQIALVSFSSYVDKRFDFNDYLSYLQVQSAIRNVPHQRGSTRTKAAFEYARDHIFGSTTVGLRSDSKKEILFITDGQQTDSTNAEVEQVAQSLKDDGVSIFAFGIDESHSIDFDHLEKVASPGDLQHLFQIEDISEFTDLISELEDQLSLVQQHDPTINCLPISF